MSDEENELSGFGVFARREQELRAPKAAEPEPEPEPAPKAERLRSPHDWAAAKGLYVKTNPHVPQTVDHYRWRHAIADKLHGWSDHDYHYADDPVRLSEQDYDAALKAAANYPNTQPHAPALKGRK